ncbi:MAG TPA: hypothetical protein VGJ05_07265 [Fimbriiglobus sp.]|jgi:hypothetical protein
MKRILFALILAAAASDARADWGCGPSGIPPQAAQAKSGAFGGSGGSGAYGCNPILKRLMWWKHDGCSSCGKGGACGSGGPTGTLVYPQHQFARSPRDWFMYGN